MMLSTASATRIHLASPLHSLRVAINGIYSTEYSTELFRVTIRYSRGGHVAATLLCSARDRVHITTLTTPPTPTRNLIPSYPSVGHNCDPQDVPDLLSFLSQSCGTPAKHLFLFFCGQKKAAGNVVMGKFAILLSYSEIGDAGLRLPCLLAPFCHSFVSAAAPNPPNLMAGVHSSLNHLDFVLLFVPRLLHPYE